jgi:hypothetical protein
MVSLGFSGRQRCCKVAMARGGWRAWSLGCWNDPKRTSAIPHFAPPGQACGLRQAKRRLFVAKISADIHFISSHPVIALPCSILCHVRNSRHAGFHVFDLAPSAMPMPEATAAAKGSDCAQFGNVFPKPTLKLGNYSWPELSSIHAPALPMPVSLRKPSFFHPSKQSVRQTVTSLARQHCPRCKPQAEFRVG